MIKVFKYDYGEGKISRKKIREVVQAVLAEKRAAKQKVPVKRAIRR